MKARLQPTTYFWWAAARPVCGPQSRLRKTSPNLSVAVVSKVYPMRSHTVSAEGGAAGAIAADDTLDEHAYDTVSGSDWLCDQDAVEAFVQEAPRELLQLEHWGCPWSREPDGRIAVRAFGGMKNMRTWFAADKTGFHMLHSLFQTSLKYADVTRYDEWFVTRLLVDDGRVHGVVAIELMTGRIEVITAKSVVLCNGGSGKVFPYTRPTPTSAPVTAWRWPTEQVRRSRTWSSSSTTHRTSIHRHPHYRGDARRRRLAAQQGRLPLSPGLRPRPARAHAGTAQHGARTADRLSQAFVHEVEKGRTIESPYGPIVHLDLRHLGAKLIDTKLPMVRELCMKYERIDPVKELIPVRPVVHYMMGGVHTDIDGATHRRAVRGRRRPRA